MFIRPKEVIIIVLVSLIMGLGAGKIRTYQESQSRVIPEHPYCTELAEPDHPVCRDDDKSNRER